MGDRLEIQVAVDILEFFYRTQVYLGSDLWVLISKSERRCANLTDMTLTDKDTNSILTDNVNRALQGKVVM